MKNRVLFILAGVGVLVGLVSAYLYAQQIPAQPPVFSPAANPYGKGIYAEGIVESYQPHGENINIYPEVAGTVTRILAQEGQQVAQGAPLLAIEDSVQRALVEQQRAQSEAALALLQQLKAQPRPENLAVAQAQMDLAAASLKTAQDSYDKQQRAYGLEPKSVSRDALDTARNSAEAARRNLQVAQRQYELTRAGAWSYDIRNQEKQYQALLGAYNSSKALLDKYTVVAPADGVVLSVATAVGSYVSPAQGSYNSYTQGSGPAIVMGHPQGEQQVRCYIDEILVHRLPRDGAIKAQMFVRGTGISVPLQFVRIQPYVSPKIELSDQRTERVDVRVLPVIFKFAAPGQVDLYPGQLVDVFIGEPDGKKG
ncbi:MAG: efflux RND transporter periplasmic adaptor subunit [Nevskia sp.]|nr:efflux RND transporter periplasmic adaptor subunit [Nevskia sp.]